MEDIVTVFNEVSLLCGHLAVEMDLVPMAWGLAQKVLVKSPGDKAALLLVAKIHLMKNEYTKVIELLRGGGKDLKLWAVFALACYRLGLCDRAVEALRHCKSLSDEEEVELDLNLDILQCRVLLLADLQDSTLQSTIPQFESTLELTQLYNVPTLHLEVLLTRAQLFEKNGDWEKCFFDLEDSISVLQNPEAMTHFQIKDFLYKTTFAYLYKVFLQKKTQTELEPTDQLFQECLRFPHTSETVHMLTVARRVHSVAVGEVFDIRQFISDLSTVSNAFKPFVYYITARIMVEFGMPENFSQALEFYQLSLELDCSRTYVWISMACLHLKLGQVPDALFAFSRTIELLASTDQQQYSISRYSYLERHDELNALAWFGMAKVYLAMDDTEKALEALEKSINTLANDNLLEKDKLEEFANALCSRDAVSLQDLKANMTIPEIPLLFFLNPIFYLEESQVFQVESRLEKSSFISPKILPTRPALQSSSRSSSSHDVSKKARKKLARRATDGIKPTKFRNKKKNDIFRRANLSISKGDKHNLTQHKKKNLHPIDENRKLTNQNTNTQEQLYNHDPNTTRAIIPSGHNITNTNINDNHITSPPLATPMIHNSTITPDQQQHFGYLYQGDEHNHSNQLHQHHETNPFNFPKFIASHNPGIYSASFSHPIQPVGFSASPSFYYPQQSIEEAYRNNSNGMSEQGLPPTFGPPVIMPQFPNPVYIPDGARFSANSLQPTIIPVMASQQPQQPQYQPMSAKNADVITYTER